MCIKCQAEANKGRSTQFHTGGPVKSSCGQILTSADAGRAIKQAAFEACFLGKMVAMQPSGLLWDASNETPSHLAPCTQSHEAIRNNEGKRRAMAARGCPPPPRSKAQAPVWINSKN